MMPCLKSHKPIIFWWVCNQYFNDSPIISRRVFKWSMFWIWFYCIYVSKLARTSAKLNSLCSSCKPTAEYVTRNPPKQGPPKNSGLLSAVQKCPRSRDGRGERWRGGMEVWRYGAWRHGDMVACRSGSHHSSFPPRPPYN